MPEQSQGHDDKGNEKIRKDIDLFGYAKHGSDSEWDKVKPLDKGMELYMRLLVRLIDAREYAIDEERKGKETMLIKDADSAIDGKAKYVRIAVRKE